MSDYAQRRRMMVDTQVRPSDVTKFPIIAAMLDVPRESFVPGDQREAAYISENIPLGGERVLLEPRTFAKLLDALNITSDMLVLDVGAGYGYSAAVLSKFSEAVVALENEPHMATEAVTLLADQAADNVIVEEGALTSGAPQHGPYDAIIVEGGVEMVPDALCDQLKEGGRMACLFMQGHLGQVRIGHKHDGKMSWRFAFNASAPVLQGFQKEVSFVL